MKRLIHSLLAAAVLVSAMTCTAFAAGSDSTTTNLAGTVTCVDSAQDKFSASYSGVTAGNQYVLLVVKGDESTYKSNITSDPSGSILYIDQKQADSSTISFDILPLAVEDSVVVLGGGDEPVVLGTINKPYTLGNVDMDPNNNIDIDDALLILKDYVKLESLDETQSLAADVDQNNVIDIDDALRILKYYVHLIDYEEMIKPA